VYWLPDRILGQCGGKWPWAVGKFSLIARRPRGVVGWGLAQAIHGETLLVSLALVSDLCSSMRFSLWVAGPGWVIAGDGAAAVPCSWSCVRPEVEEEWPSGPSICDGQSQLNLMDTGLDVGCTPLILHRMVLD
jgi:hypothetical protein